MEVIPQGRETTVNAKLMQQSNKGGSGTEKPSLNHSCDALLLTKRKGGPKEPKASTLRGRSLDSLLFMAPQYPSWACGPCSCGPRQCLLCSRKQSGGRDDRESKACYFLKSLETVTWYLLLQLIHQNLVPWLYLLQQSLGNVVCIVNVHIFIKFCYHGENMCYRTVSHPGYIYLAIINGRSHENSCHSCVPIWKHYMPPSLHLTFEACNTWPVCRNLCLIFSCIEPAPERK